MRAWLNSQKAKARKLYWILRKGFPLRMWLCDVDLERIPASTVFHHPIGIVIARNTVIGENCHIYQNVTLGTGVGDNRGPIIGDKVVFYPGSMVIGHRRIENGAVIGAGAVIHRDVGCCEIVKRLTD